MINILKSQCKYFGINGELKGSNIKIKHRKKLLESINNVSGVYQIFLVENIEMLTKIDFNDKEKIRLHKNYLIKRIIEQLNIKGIIDSETNLFINIDQEMLSTERYRESLENHLNDYWKNKRNYYKGCKYSQFIPSINTKFNIKFLNSEHHILIQLADLLVNTKYRRYKEIDKCCSEFLRPFICVKVPSFFSSGKSNIDI